MDTQQLREMIKSQRTRLSQDQILQSAKQISQHLLNTIEFKKAEHIAYYLPARGEADPTLLLNKVTNKSFYLPILKQGDDTGLNFTEVTKQTRFKTNKYGIPEPLSNHSEMIGAEELDMVITPLVSFDYAGNRVGMGGGFYDRTFYFKQPDSSIKPLLVGYAYDFQHSKILVPEHWDVKLDAVVTEKGFVRC